MSELIQRSLRLWQRAQRPGAGREDVDRAVAAVPELCSALDAALLRLEERGACTSPRHEPHAENEVDRLGYYVAHEVRNRLNLVEISVERAAVLSGDPQVRSALDPVRRAFRHLAAIADDLRSAGASPGTAAAARREVPRLPLRSVVEDLLATSRDLAAEEGIVLEMDGECPEVEVDVARLEHVRVNRLTNALRHAGGGRGRWIRVQACWREGSPGVLEIRVRDNGAGISADLRDAIFEDRAAAPGSSPPQSGMGLAIVRQAVERGGGRVWLESEEGVGTTVCFTLPTGAQPARPRSREQPAPLSRAPGPAP